jgi:hypothetical protein
MRLMGAGLFVFTGLLAAVGLLDALHLSTAAPALVVAFGLVVVMIGLIAAASVLFSPRSPLTGIRPVEELVEELEAQGLLVSQHFAVSRAFEVEEFEDEGMHFYLELSDGRVLFMSGQYLYDYEPHEDGGHDPRRFPCDEFLVLRHRDEGYVVDLQCTGQPLKPELLAPPFGEDVWRQGALPKDGAIIVDATYDQIKRLRIGPLRSA